MPSKIDEVLSVIPYANDLTLETLTSIIIAGRHILVELIDLVNSVNLRRPYSDL